MKKITLILILGLILVGCGGGAVPETEEAMPEEPTMPEEPAVSEPEATPTEEPPASTPTEEALAPEAAPLMLTSPAFEEGQPIPALFSCDGEDISPELAWSEPPAGTQSLALIVDDPDAPVGTWVHWVVYNLPAERRGLPQGVPGGEQIEGGGLQGSNSWGRKDYGGPCPPSGTHRYFFKLYALDITLDAGAGLSKEDVEKAMEGHILAQAELMGTYAH